MGRLPSSATPPSATAAASSASATPQPRHSGARTWEGRRARPPGRIRPLRQRPCPPRLCLPFRALPRPCPVLQRVCTHRALPMSAGAALRFHPGYLGPPLRPHRHLLPQRLVPRLLLLQHRTQRSELRLDAVRVRAQA